MRENFRILNSIDFRDGNEETITYLTGLTSYVFPTKKDLLNVYGEETLRNVLNVINSQPIVITGLSNEKNPPAYETLYEEEK